MNANTPTVSNGSKRVEGDSFVEFFYQHRGQFWLWAVTLAVSTAIFFVLAYFSPLNDHELLRAPGPWTFLIVVSGLPIAFVVWAVRDRNKQRELVNIKLQLENDSSRIRLQQQQHLSEMLHQDTHALNERFLKLQEWATNPANPILQAAAIHQLGHYIFSDPVVIPTEFSSRNKNPWILPAIEVIRALLNDRSWVPQTPPSEPTTDYEKELAKQPFRLALRRSPVIRAIEIVLSDRKSPGRHFSGWNFTGVELTGVEFPDSNFSLCDLTDAAFSYSNLERSNFEMVRGDRPKFLETNLKYCNFQRAQMKEADFRGADLRNSEFRGADLFRVDFFNANLVGANLTGTSLIGANFDGAHVDGAMIPTQAVAFDMGRPRHQWIGKPILV